MPELPEIFNLARQMNGELTGKKISAVEVRQEKCLNIPVPEFQSLVTGKTINSVRPRGKWLFVKLEPGACFLLSLGMGGDVLYHREEGALPDKYQLKFDFSDGSFLTVGFWWFGYAHAVEEGRLKEHKMTSSLGISPLDEAEYTFENFSAILKGKKGAVKPLLMSQGYLAGIGNVYIQDILFRAKLHPHRKISQISGEERKLLFEVIREDLKKAAALGGLAYEKDLYGQPGGFKDFLVGYKEGQPCPACGAVIQKIKTGSTASYICPSCQALPQSAIT